MGENRHVIGRRARALLVATSVLVTTVVTLVAGSAAPVAAADDSCTFGPRSVVQQGDRITVGGQGLHCGGRVLRSDDGGWTWRRPGDEPAYVGQTSRFEVTSLEVGADGAWVRERKTHSFNNTSSTVEFSDDGDIWDLNPTSPVGPIPSIYDRDHYWVAWDPGLDGIDDGVNGKDEVVKLFPADFNADDIDRTGTTTGLAIGAGTGRIIRTSDGGTSWSTVPVTGLPSVGDLVHQRLDIDASSGRGMALWQYSPNFGNPSTAVYGAYTSDRGVTWSPAKPVISGIYTSAWATSAPAPGTAYVSGQVGSDQTPVLRRTTDGGQTWNTVGLPVGSGHYVSDMSFTTALRGTVVDYDDAIYRTSDGGSTWSAGYQPKEHTHAWSPMFAPLTPNTGTRTGTSATLTYATPQSDGGSPIAGFDATARRLDATAAPVTAQVGPSARSITLTGLAPDGQYEIGLRVRNEAGNIDRLFIRPGEKSAFWFNTPTLNGRQVNLVTITPGTGGSPSNTVNITPYRNGVAQPVQRFPVTAAPYSIQGQNLTLPAGTYRFRFTVTNVAGESEPSDLSSEIVVPAEAPSHPVTVQAAAGNAQATVTWTPPSDDGGTPVTGYTVTPVVGGTAGTPRPLAASARTTTFTGLANGVSHTFRVAATNSVGTGMALDSNAVTPQAAVPGAPTGVTAVPGDARATVSWTAPTANGGAAVTGYVITPYQGATALFPIEAPAAPTSETVLGLTNGVATTFKVAARNAAGVGAQSAASAPVTPVGATRPSAPTNVSATAGNERATVTWSPPSSTGGADLYGYWVQASVAGDVVDDTYVSVDDPRTHTFEDLTNGVPVTLSVSAENEVGEGPTASAPPVTPSGSATAPGAPTGVTAVAGVQAATVSWTAPASTGGSPITGYVVTPYVGTTARPATTVGNVAATTITGLTAGTAVTFKVAARNAIGTGAQSAASVAVTPTAPGTPTPPGAPQSVTSQGRDRSVVATWAPPAAAGSSAITGYTVTVLEGTTARGSATVAGSARTATVGGLANGAGYTVRVTATSTAGTGPAASAAGTTVPVPFASTAAFVAQTFRDLTGKAPPASESSTWTAQIDTHAKAPADLVAALRRSPDATGVVDPVARLYRAYFGRIPDAGGLTYWIGQRRSGVSLTKISDGFARSREFTQVYGTLTNRQFVERVYQNILGRPGEASGVDYWTSQLDQRRKTRGGVMIGFSESAEYKRSQAAEVDTAVVFISLLGRAPTTAEHTQWVTALERTTAPATVTELAATVLRDPGYS